MRPWRLVRAALLAAGLAHPAPAAEMSLPLPEARALAVKAALAGNVPVASLLARELLKADPRDPDALLAKSTVALAFGAWDEAYRSSRKAFRFSDNKVNRFHAARIAATAAVADKRLIPAQFWLRRAGDLAPTAVDRAKIERNFAMLRAETPWRYRFSLSAMPSDNVNGGSDYAYNIIDGIPFVGTLSPSARALSGLVVQSSTHVGYRFDRSARSQTEVNADLFLKRVYLSDEAKAKAPGYDPSGLNATALSLGLAHTRLVGEAGTVLRFEAGLRDNWVRENREYTALTGAATWSRRFGERLRLTGRLQAERRFYTNSSYGFVGTAQVSAAYTFGNGNRLSGLVSYTENVTPIYIFDSRAWVGKVTYSLAEPVLGGVMLSAGIGASMTEYPDYTFLILPVPGGRQDDGVFFDLDATFTQFEYAGFSPSLRLRRAFTESNVSRFTTSEWAVSVGIASNF